MSRSLSTRGRHELLETIDPPDPPHAPRSREVSASPEPKLPTQLEDLEGRVLLSTTNVWEYLDGQARHVATQVVNNGVELSSSDTLITGNPSQSFTVNTYTDTVNVQNTIAGVPLTIVGHNQETIDVA